MDLSYEFKEVFFIIFLLEIIADVKMMRMSFGF